MYMIDKLKLSIRITNLFLSCIGYDYWVVNFYSYDIAVCIFSRTLSKVYIHMYLYVHDTIFNNKSYKKPYFCYVR